MASSGNLGELSILNPNPKLLEGPQLLHELLSSSGTHELPAIDFLSNERGSVSVPYSKLQSMSTALARHITSILVHSKGSSVPRGSFIIPVLLPQSPELYIVLLAILKAGAAFCPLNLDAPPDRLKFILDDVSAKIVIAGTSLASKIPKEPDDYEIIPIGNLDESPTFVENESTPPKRPSPHDLAYIMYTSGSTGTPKGVGISHFAATQALLAHDRHIPQFTRFLQFAAPTFDVSVFEIFFPLFRGKTVVCCDRPEMLNDLPAVLRKMDVDACELTPSVTNSLLRSRSNAPGLRLLLTIGEMLTEPVIQEFGGDDLHDSLLWAMYGPTEATIHCTLQSAFSNGFTRNNIGVPLDTVSAFVIEPQVGNDDTPQFTLLPVDHIGELAVGGSQLAAGYLSQPDQTAKVFLETPWGKVYKTGDKARIRPDGTIECLGRIADGQVKLNGQRLELGEIEHAALRTPGCYDAFTAVIANGLVVFAAVDDTTEIRKRILSTCRSWLPAFMTPTDIVTVKDFPRLPSGKVDRKRLIRDYGESGSKAIHIGTQYENDIERRLCEIAEQTLHQPINPLTRLSSAGIDSLVAIQYASTLRNLNIAFDPVDVLDAPTIRDLARTRDTGLHQHREQSIARDTVDSTLDYLEIEQSLKVNFNQIERVNLCTAVQEAMIVETLKDPKMYINQIELRLPHYTSADSIRSWFLGLAQHNEILRTGFAHVDHELRQIVWKRLEDQQISVVADDSFLGSLDSERFIQRPLRIEIRPPSHHDEDKIVVLILHHAIYDGWTIDLLVEDLALMACGKDAIERPQFSNISTYLSIAREAESMDAKEFWTQHLRGLNGAAVPNFRTIVVSDPTIKNTTTEFRTRVGLVSSFCNRYSITPQVVFQACLLWLWGAINGTEHVTIGSVSSGRALPVAEIEKIMGPCMATLPLSVNLGRFQAIDEFLRYLQATNRESLRHGKLPLADIKRACGVAPAFKLFDVVFAYQETLPSRNNSGLVRETRHIDAIEASLLVEIQPSKDRFKCHLTWHTVAFSEGQVDMLGQHLGHLVEHVLQDGHACMNTIPRCIPEHLLSRYNEVPKYIQLPSSLSELVESTVTQYSQHNALCFASEIGASAMESATVTYQSLNARANRIARALQALGATPGAIIAIMMEKSTLLYCSILAILKTGCAYLPILPSTPVQRTMLILEQAEPLLCITDAATLPTVTSNPIHNTVNIDTLRLSTYSDTNLDITPDASALAYVIYTSGTTGAPKGVAVTHTNVLSNINELSRIYPHTTSSRMLQACSQAFDVSVFEIFFAWANGMCLCSATNDTMYEDLERAIQALQVTHLSMTVTVASLIDPRNLPDVELLVTSGEPMTGEVLAKWSKQLYQGYGPSETTNICTVRKISNGDSPQFLGWSLENTSSFVLYPKSTKLVPRGCIGELCFGGEQVASGYLRLPDLTATKFVIHHKYGRLYRSGDIGRMLPDGSLVILGRMDSQVKLRGLRIELQEIQELVLSTGIARTCTSELITVGTAGSQHVAVFYVPKDCMSMESRYLPLNDSMRQQITKLRQILRDALQEYMVPSFIFPMSSLPLTSSGKVDGEHLRRSVHTLPQETLTACSSSQEPHDELEWTESETKIADILTDTLKVDKQVIGRWSSFASVGLDSISAMPVVRKLQTAFRRRIPLSLVLQNPSIGRLASRITDSQDMESNPLEEYELLPRPISEAMTARLVQLGRSVTGLLPCTPLQEAMLVSFSTKDGQTPYYNHMLFRLHLPSDVMIRHWNHAFKRHEILRTCFMTTDNMRYPVIQAVLEVYKPSWQHLQEGSTSFSELISNHIASVPTALDSAEPPISLAMVTTRDSREYLSFVCHHAIYDGISIRKLLSEIESMVRDAKLQVSPTFESFIREALRPRPMQDSFWRRHLQDFSPHLLVESDLVVVNGMKTISSKLSHLSLSSIERQVQDLDISLLSLCQCAWAISLSLLSKAGDICFGNVVSGRSIPIDNVDSLVAPCFNTLPIRIDLSRSKIPLEIMRKFQKLSADMIPYQFTSLRHIQQQFSPDSRLFDTLLLLQPPWEPLDDTIWSLEEDTGSMDVPLVCEIIPSRKDNCLELHLHRDSSSFSYETLILLRDIFSQVTESCIQYPLSYIMSIEMLPAHCQEEMAQLFSPRAGQNSKAPADDGTNDESWTQRELQVRSAISKLTEVPESNIGRQTPIYRYGIDSIAAVQLATLLRDDHIMVSAIDVIENPTCAGIASSLEPKLNSDDIVPFYDFDAFETAVGSSLHEIKDLPTDIEAVLPCTPTQQGLLSEFLSSEGEHYFNFASWDLHPPLEPQLIGSSWARLASIHQVLRTGFASVDSHDVSFAMIVFSETKALSQLSYYKSHSFDLNRWRLESAQKVLNQLWLPPWYVAIVTTDNRHDGDDGTQKSSMHLAIHHALYDAFSLHALLGELAVIVLGGETTAGKPIQSVLPQFYPSPESRITAKTFWESKADKLVVNKFPNLTPLCVDVHAYSTASSTCGMSYEKFRRKAAEADVTAQAAIQAAWTRLLSAYIGEPYVTFGLVLDGRTTAEARKARFPMIVTLPAVTQNSSSNEELLQSMMQYNAGLRRHERSSLQDIQRWLGRPDGRLFDTLIIYQITDETFQEYPWTLVDENGSTDYPLSLEITKSPPGLIEFTLTFDTQILPVEQARILLKQFDAILVDLLEFPNSHFFAASMKDPDICSVLPASQDRLPSEARLLHQLVEQSALQIPNSIALEFIEGLRDKQDRRQWTYRELNDMGNRVADLILAQEIPSSSIVAVCLDKCPEAYFVALGILKAGCAFLFLDPSAPIARRDFILTDSHAAVLLVGDSSSAENYPNAKTRIQVVSEKRLLDSFSAEPRNEFHRVLPSDTCYCLYTSGTTGTPKGCLISHDNVVQAMLAFQEIFEGHWDSQSRWLQFAAFHFDVSVLEQFWSWYVGITLVAAPKDLILSDLAGTISSLGITHIDLTPSLARLIHPDEVPNLCQGIFITGGEQLRQEILQTWGPHNVIYNAYGPTETTIGVTIFKNVPENARPSNIGKQFPNVGVYVLTPGTQLPVLRGAVGELCVSGRLVGKGYLNRPEMTKERFPTLEHYGDRIYRTGDLVRVLYDGSFDFLGRADDQIKLRGQRLEIGEINNAIKTGLPHDVKDVATLVARPAAQDRDLLVSFIAPISAGTLQGDLRILDDRTSIECSAKALDACQSRLPGYMIPTYILVVPFIPLSTNNKTDLNYLRKLFADLPQDHLGNLRTGSSAPSRPLSDRERMISMAISKTLSIHEASIHPSSTVFELGIDSITAIRLARRLRSVGFAFASSSLILQHPQIDQLAKALQHAGTGIYENKKFQIKQSIRGLYHQYIGTVCRILEVDSTDVEYVAPCAPLQEGMLVRSKAQESQTPYFNQFQLQINDGVSLDRLQSSWTRVVAAFPILRTAFVATGDGYLQVATKNPFRRWYEVNNLDMPMDDFVVDRKRQWIQANDEVIRSPLEIDHFTHQGKHVLLLRLFHAIYDAHSFELILRNVLADYCGEKITLGPRYLDVLAAGPLSNHDQSRKFWESTFKGSSIQQIYDFPVEQNSSTKTLSRILRIDGLRRQHTALGVTPQTLIQACWLAALRQHFGISPSIGVVFSGRSLPIDDIDLVVGPLFNTLPFKIINIDDNTWTALIQNVHKFNTKVLDFVHTPLRDIQKWCSNGQPLFDSLFVFEREDTFVIDKRSPVWTVNGSVADVDYVLSLEVVLARDESLRVTLVARQGLADERSTEALLGKFAHCLESLADIESDVSLPVAWTAEYSGPITSNSSLTSNESVTPSSATSAESSLLDWSYQAQTARAELASIAGVGEDSISKLTNIFELGLDSIDIIKLSSRLNRLGIEVSASSLRRTPTFAGILKQSPNGAVSDLPEKGSDNVGVSVPLLRDSLATTGMDFADVESILPPTPLQDSMVADMLLSDFYRYFNHDVLEISPETNLDRLLSAWSIVYAGSPILRTTFAEIDDPQVPHAFCQVVKKGSLKCQRDVKISEIDKIAKVFEDARICATQAMGTSNLFQLSMARTSTKNYLVVSIAHALYDGWSLKMLHNDVHAAYDGHYRKRDDYEHYLLHHICELPPQSQQFWNDFLHGSSPTLLQPREGGTKAPHFHRSEARSTFNVKDFKSLCAKYRTTPQILAQSCWAAVLATCGKSLDVVFGVVLSGRDTEEARDLLFPMMNTVPLRVVLHGTNLEFLGYVQNIMSDVMRYQHTPLRQAQKRARAKGEGLFNTLFLLQNSPEQPDNSRRMLQSVRSSSEVDYPICVEMEFQEDDILWRVGFSNQFISLEDAKNVLTSLEDVLHHFANYHHANILKVDGSSNKISVCGLKMFTPQDSVQDDLMPLSTSPSTTVSQVSGTLAPLVEILSELSGIEERKITLEHSIYHLGLDSISAIKAISMLGKRGLSISVRDLLKATSIGVLSPQSNGQGAQGDTKSLNFQQAQLSLRGFEISSLLKKVGIGRDLVEKVLPALPIQVHTLSTWQNSGGRLFFSRFPLRISGQVDIEVLASSWASLVNEIPNLRTQFVATGSQETPVIQLILRADPAAKFLCRMESQSSAGQQELLCESSPYSIMRASQIDSGEWHVHLYFHHALYDGVSLPLILNRFTQLCIHGQDSGCISAPGPWYEFVFSHNDSELRHNRRRFWTSYLQGAQTAKLWHPLEQDWSGQDREQVSQLRKDAVNDLVELKALARDVGVSLQALFYATYAKVLAGIDKRSNTVRGKDIVLGLYIANRTGFPELGDLPLPTLNILPLRTRNPFAKEMNDLAVEIQKDLVDIGNLANSTVGLWEIHQWTGIQVDTFVNFLSPPARLQDGEQRLPLIHGEDEEVFKFEGVDPRSDAVRTTAKALSSNGARASYLDAVDIEVSINESSMNIGIFSPPSLLTTTGAETLINDIILTLQMSK